MSMYQRINGADWRNIFVVGDLHGCYTLLMSELEKASFDPARDLLISVGDLVDRGAENVECLELITMPWFRAVRGNHEQMMIDGLSASLGNLGSEVVVKNTLWTEYADAQTGDFIFIGESVESDPLVAGADKILQVIRYADTFNRTADDYALLSGL